MVTCIQSAASFLVLVAVGFVVFSEFSGFSGHGIFVSFPPLLAAGGGVAGDALPE